MNGTQPKGKEFEFPGFPRRDDEHGENTWRYVDRYNREGRRPDAEPWEVAARPIEPPKEQPLMPYVDREPGEEG
jgi:hypothetical protein